MLFRSYSNGGAPPASPGGGDSLSARTLRAHTCVFFPSPGRLACGARADGPCCRAHLPQTTRTKRALIRHCYAAGDMMISEIAEFVSCDHRTVWAVVRNEGDDDLGEDQRYLDCEVGDIVNVEALGEMKPFVKKEPVEDDSALLKARAVNEEEYDSEAEVEDQCALPSRVLPVRAHSLLDIHPSSDTPPLRCKRQLSVESDVSMLSSLTSLADGEDVGTDVPMSASDIKHYILLKVCFNISYQSDSASASHAHFESASPGPSSTVYSNGTHGSPATSKLRASDGVVEAFMRSLGGPSDRLIQLFYEMEIDNAEHLDWLCTMQEDYWEDVKDYLLRNGVKLFHWLVVKKGLRDRAAALAASATP